MGRIDLLMKLIIYFFTVNRQADLVTIPANDITQYLLEKLEISYLSNTTTARRFSADGQESRISSLVSFTIATEDFDCYHGDSLPTELLKTTDKTNSKLCDYLLALSRHGNLIVKNNRDFRIIEAMFNRKGYNAFITVENKGAVLSVSRMRSDIPFSNVMH